MALKTRDWIRAFGLLYFSLLANAGAIGEVLTVSLSSPTGQPLPYSINIAGSFNQWQMDEQSTMSWDESTTSYQFSIPESESTILFNIYKEGNWQNPLATEYGKAFTCGFVVPPGNTQKIEPEFRGWANDNTLKRVDTVTGELITLDAFPMSQLQRSGNIYIYLPDSYHQSPNKHYPVAYMLDGQNLFSESLSYSYEWQVDETVTKEKLDIIVVGIANGPERWQEYNPWDTVDFMGTHISAKGQETIAFIKNQLKPHVDKHYRTRKEPQHTGFLGSSLGGLMAMYAAIEHSDTFARVAAFSPSFSFSSVEAQQSLNPAQSSLLRAIKKSTSAPKSKVYFDVGEVEYGDFTLINALNQSLLSAGYSQEQLKMVQDKQGRHCELDWARRLSGALIWLFDNES